MLFNKIKLIQPDSKIIDDKCLCLPNFDELINNNVDLVLYSTGYAKQIELGYGGYAYINKLIEKGERHFVMNFRECNFIDSTGLGVLVAVYKKVMELGGSFELNSIDNPQVMKIFKLTRLDKVFDIK